jgi:hypothetical protein
LSLFREYSLKYILVPTFQINAVMQILNDSFPLIQLSLHQLNEKVGFIEILNSVPMVSIDKGEVKKFEVKGNSVIAEILPAQQGSALTFAWVANKDFHVYVNNKEVKWYEDAFGRVRVDLYGSDLTTVKLRFFPKKSFYFFIIGILLSGLGFFCVVFSSNKRRNG